MSNYAVRRIGLIILVLAAIVVDPGYLMAQQGSPATDSDTTASDVPASSDNSLLQAIRQLQEQLATQSKQIEQLQAQYTSEVEARQKEIDKQGKQLSEQAKEISTQRQAIASLQQQVDQTKTVAGEDLDESEKELRSRLETLEQSIKSSQQSESTTYDLDSFAGSIPIPGTSSAIKFGGFVNMNMVQSFDPVGAGDRFIVGSIPVPQESSTSQGVLTVSHSRFNVEMRDTTKYGPVRAFIEGDFMGDGDTFRLRHAFGQYKSFLIGKTWTTFMDDRSKNEDLDFEGINGQILLRQAQVRYFPQIGQNLHLLVSLEDPNAVIAGGEGVNLHPDLVVSIERAWFDTWHVRSSLLLRKLDGECDCLDKKSDSTSAWAYTLSGMTAINLWDERDNLQIQFSYGEGFSNYVNDLGTIGAADAVFDPVSGRLIPVTVFATYVAFQKWWSPTMRSNFNYGYVNVIDKNLAGDPSAYKSTRRFTLNYIWSPIPRIDLGAEFLMGSRANQDGQKGKATQLQLSAKYRY
jgi:hypothetical protein